MGRLHAAAPVAMYAARDAAKLSQKAARMQTTSVPFAVSHSPAD